MSTVTTDEMNKAIALFDSWKINEKTIYSDSPQLFTKDKYNYKLGCELKYHTSWESLMPVYHKVREKAFELKDNATAAQLFAKVMEQILYGTIADVHLNLYQFITWYNSQKP